MQEFIIFLPQVYQIIPNLRNNVVLEIRLWHNFQIMVVGTICKK